MCCLLQFCLFYPIQGDSTALPEQPLSMFLRNQVASPVPLVLGVVANESMIFVYQGLGSEPSEGVQKKLRNKTKKQRKVLFSNLFFQALYIAFLGDVFNVHAPDILKQYPPHQNNRTSEKERTHTFCLIFSFKTVLHTLSLLGTDFIMACPARRVAAASRSPAFLYYFDHVFSFSQKASSFLSFELNLINHRPGEQTTPNGACVVSFLPLFVCCLLMFSV